MFSHGELQLELFGTPKWHPQLLEALNIEVDA